ncbi:MAG TPA: DEAD/DEAH box helicase [Conexibacter sp.]|nr:DEAD/DEAH box helicase [Conexibacter sp.]
MQQSTFADLGVSKAVAGALRERGIERPFAVQELVVGDVLDGHDVLVESPTGSGKTLAFGIPLVDCVEPGRKAGRKPGEPGALVLAPTRELASQIVDELDAIARARGLSVAAVYGGAGINPQIRAARRADVLVATPGRLVDLLDRRAVTLGEVGVLVLDEADRMLDMGFRPVVDRLVALTPEDRQTMLFSATLAGEVDRIARAYTYQARRHAHRGPTGVGARGNVEHRFVKVTRERRTDQLVAELTEQERGRTLVFVRTKRGADRLAKQLSRVATVKVAAMHGDKSQAQRERALAQFESGRIDTLVATDVAARGIDVRDVTHVINFDAPAASEDYVHRVGRTARAGADGVGITFVLADQVRDVVSMAARLGLQRELEDAGFAVAATPTRRSGPPSSGGSRSRNRRRRSGRPRPVA